MSYKEPVKRHLPIEQTPIYVKLVELSNWVWKTARSWDDFARDTLGKQIVRSCDSVGANLVEADGRFSQNDALSLLVIARGSARETAHWFRLARDRELVDRETIDQNISEWDVACRELNGLINYRRNHAGVKEHRANYNVDDAGPNFDDLLEWLNSWPPVNGLPETE